MADLARGLGAGLRSIEHLKRFTTDRHRHRPGQNGAASSPPASRPPCSASPSRPSAPPPSVRRSCPSASPSSPGAIAATCTTRSARRRCIAGTSPTARCSSTSGSGSGPWYYPQPGEDMHAAVVRECRAARTRVGVMDARRSARSTSRVRTPPSFSIACTPTRSIELAVGSIRYGLMCRADGMVFDDGVVLRLAPDRFLTTTTTGNAAAVLEWMEEWLQTEWPDAARATDIRHRAVGDHRRRRAARPRGARPARRPDIDVDPRRVPVHDAARRHGRGRAGRACAASASRASWPSRSTCRPGRGCASGTR